MNSPTISPPLTPSNFVINQKVTELASLYELSQGIRWQFRFGVDTVTSSHESGQGR